MLHCVWLHSTYCSSFVIQNGLWMASHFLLEPGINQHMTLDMCLSTSTMLMLKILEFTCARQPTTRAKPRLQAHWDVPVSMWDFRFWEQCCRGLKPSGMGGVLTFCKINYSAFKMSRTAYSTSQYYIREDLNLGTSNCFGWMLYHAKNTHSPQWR